MSTKNYIKLNIRLPNMGKVKSVALKKAVLDDIKGGMSYREIGKKHRISIGYITKIKSESNLSVPKKKGGKPRKLSPADERAARRLIVSGAAKTAVEANEVLKNELGVTVSNKTIRRSLNRSGLKAKTKIKKPALTPKHRKLRYEFAKKYEHYTIEDWMKVTWSDETKINRVGSDGRQWTWVDTQIGLQERNICQTLKFGGGGMMLWGCFRGNQIGVLRRIRGIMRATDYIDILEDSYLPSLDIFGVDPGQNDTFMQDNDPKHTAKITKTWMNDNGIKLLNWPPQSPDMNPIEHLWAILKRKIFAQKDPPKDLDALWERTLTEWQNISPDILEKLVESMPNRIKALKKSRGGHTKY